MTKCIYGHEDECACSPRIEMVPGGDIRRWPVRAKLHGVPRPV